jgi:hypothetical protein
MFDDLSTRLDDDFAKKAKKTDVFPKHPNIGAIMRRKNDTREGDMR